MGASPTWATDAIRSFLRSFQEDDPSEKEREVMNDQAGSGRSPRPEDRRQAVWNSD